MIYGATGATDFSAIARALSQRRPRDRPADADRDRAVRRGPVLQGLGGAVPPVDAGRLRGRADAGHGVHGGRHEGRRARRVPALLRRRADQRAGRAGRPALAVLATITIIVGNVGALGQSSLKRMLAYSSVAQAGYMLAGVVVASRLGVRATVFYLAVVPVHEHGRLRRDRRARARDGPRRLRRRRSPGWGASARGWPWPMTISMLALAGIPATAGFIGKFYLIDAAVSGGYTWLGVVIVVGSMISLGYYLPVVAAMWMREAPREQPPRAGRPRATAAGARRRLARARRASCRARRRGTRAARPLAPRAQPARSLLVAAARRRGDDLLRRHPPAAVRPRPPRGRRAQRAVLSARGARALRRC